MAAPNALTPTPEQQQRQRQLEADRLRAGQRIDFGPREEASTDRGDAAPAGGREDAQAAAGNAIDRIGRSSKDPRIKAAVAAAKIAGVDKKLAERKEVQALAGAADAVQSGDVKALVRAGSTAWKRINWIGFGANAVLEPLSAFSLTFVGIQVYAFASVMLGEDVLEPPSIGEWVAIVALTIVQMIVLLGVAAMGSLVYCMMDPSCQYDIAKNAITDYFGLN